MKKGELMTTDDRVDKFLGIMADRVEKFLEAIRQLALTLQELGAELVSMLEEDPDVKKKIVEREKGLRMQFLNDLEAVGRGTLHPRLALESKPGYSRLKALPLSDQERYLNEPLELVVMKDGDFDVLQVKVEDLQPAQAKQIFDKNSIRSLAAQRAYIESLKTEKAVADAAKECPQPYVIRNGKITFLQAGYTGDVFDLMSALAQATRRQHHGH